MRGFYTRGFGRGFGPGPRFRGWGGYRGFGPGRGFGYGSGAQQGYGPGPEQGYERGPEHGHGHQHPHGQPFQQRGSGRGWGRWGHPQANLDMMIEGLEQAERRLEGRLQWVKQRLEELRARRQQTGQQSQSQPGNAGWPQAGSSSQTDISML